MREVEREYEDFDVYAAYDDGLVAVDQLFDQDPEDTQNPLASRVIPTFYDDLHQRSERELDKSFSQDEEAEELLYCQDPDRIKELAANIALRHVKLASWFVRQTMGIDGRKRNLITETENGEQIRDRSSKRFKGRYVGYLDNLARYEMDYDDRFQVTFEHMLKAIPRFTGKRKMSTHVMDHIEGNAIREFKGLAMQAHIPQDRYDAPKIAAKEILDAEMKGVVPSLARIAFLSGLGMDRAEFEIDRFRMLEKVSLVDYAEYLKYLQIDDYEGQAAEDGLDYTDLVADELAFEAMEERVFNSVLAGYVELAFEALTEKERDIIEFRSGISGGEAKTLEEIGNIFGVTRERIRQIESKALAKLCNSSYDTYRLHSFTNEANVYPSSGPPVSLPELSGFESKLGLTEDTVFDRTPLPRTPVKRFVYQEDWIEEDLS